MLEKYVYKYHQRLRCGYTTGSCAAAAAGAAALTLLRGEPVKEYSLLTPGGMLLRLDVESVSRSERKVTCGVKKDGGDDPDVTDGLLICASVEKCEKPGVYIEGGCGVGVVTKPGLEQAVGEPAINRVPRSMIEGAVRAASGETGYDGGMLVVISVPGGREAAKRTFNPLLGIEGGISILGTSGIVEPMSEEAMVDTIRVQVNMQAASGKSCCVVVPGNYGADFMEKELGLDPEQTVKCSNFIGRTIDIVCESGMKGFLLAGHMGKLVKLGGGIMDTHSRNADARMEILCSCSVAAGADKDVLLRVLSCNTTEEAVDVLAESGRLAAVMDVLMGKIEGHLRRRAGGKLQAEAVVFSNGHGFLGKTSGADRLLRMLREQADTEY